MKNRNRKRYGDSRQSGRIKESGYSGSDQILEEQLGIAKEIET